MDMAAFGEIRLSAARFAPSRERRGESRSAAIHRLIRP
jgi:hypothetical protein